jgi:hypothetical protein
MIRNREMTDCEGSAHVWFSPLGARNHDPKLKATITARPMNMLHLEDMSVRAAAVVQALEAYPFAIVPGC